MADVLCQPDLQTLHSKYGCLKTATRKLKTISRFFKRQVSNADVEKFVLPACVAIHSNSRSDASVDDTLEPISEYACAVADLRSEHDANVDLVSEAGRHALGNLILKESYKHRDEVREHVADGDVVSKAVARFPNIATSAQRKRSLDDLETPTPEKLQQRRLHQQPMSCIAMTIAREHHAQLEEQLPLPDSDLPHNNAQQQRQQPDRGRGTESRGAHTRTSRPVLLGVAHAPLPSADPSATVRTPGANATVSNVPPVLRHAPAPPPLAAVPRSIAASATSNEKQEEEHLPPGMPPPQNINRSCVPSQTMAEPTTSDEKDEDEELLPPGMAPLSAPPVHSRMLQFQVPEFGVPPVPMDASVARPPPPLAAVPAGTKAKGFYAPTPEYTTSQLPTEAKQQQKKQTTAQVAEHDARDEEHIATNLKSPAENQQAQGTSKGVDGNQQAECTQQQAVARAVHEVEQTGGGREDDHLECAEYASDIFTFFRRMEPTIQVDCEYMNRQRYITRQMRALLSDWIVDVHAKFKLIPESLFLAIYILDRFLSKQEVERMNLQLAGIAALVIANKHEEAYNPVLKDYETICAGAYTRADILRMERSILNTLDFDLTVPTAFTFLAHYIKASSYDQYPEFRNLSQYLCEWSLLSYHCLRWPGSMVAAAAIYASFRAFSINGEDNDWPRVMRKHTGYTLEEIKPCATYLVNLMDKARSTQYRALFHKFKEREYSGVARYIAPTAVLA